MLGRGTNSPQSVKESAPDCCAGDARISKQFDERIAELTADGELPEMVDVSSMLLRLMGDVESVAPTLLELGSGSGALTVKLLRRGAVSADAIDLSPEMIAAGRRRATEADVSDRVTFVLGDAAEVSVTAHDWVVIDRVFCCYPRADRLLANATRAATRRVAFTLPTSRGWRGLVNKIIWRGENIPLRFGASGCPGFIHSVDKIERQLAAAGFTLRASDRLGLWYAAVWDRSATAEIQ